MYVSNDTYRNTMNRYNDANSRNAAMDAARRRARQNLTQTHTRGDNLARQDRQALDAALAREGSKLLEGLDGVSDEFAEKLGRLNVQMREDIRRQERELAAIRQRTGNLERTAREYDVRISAVDARVSQLDERADQIQGDLNESNRNAAAIDQKVTDLSQDISRRFNELAERTEREKDRARVYINQLQVVLDRIETLHPDQLAPEEAMKIRQTLDSARQDLENGDYQASIGLVQVRLPDAFQLEITLLALNDEFHQLLETFRQQAETVGREIEDMDDQDKNRGQIMEESDKTKQGSQIYFDGRIDFWSEGWLLAENTNLSNACQDVDSIYLDSMDIEGLRGSIETVAEIQRKLPACSALAREQYRQHHALVSTKERIEAALVGTPWSVVDYGYESDDERNAFGIIFEDGDGHTASVVIVPNRWKVGNRFQAQFNVNMSEGAEVESEILCETLRAAFMAILNGYELAEGITSRRGAEPETKPNQGRDAFLQQTMLVGDSIIDARINLARQVAGR